MRDVLNQLVVERVEIAGEGGEWRELIVKDELGVGGPADEPGRGGKLPGCGHGGRERGDVD